MNLYPLISIVQVLAEAATTLLTKKDYQCCAIIPLHKIVMTPRIHRLHASINTKKPVITDNIRWWNGKKFHPLRIEKNKQIIKDSL